MKPLIALSALSALTLAFTLGAQDKPLPPDSTEATGQTFADPKPGDALRVLVLGAGSSHDFPKYFIGTDATTLRQAGGLDVAATLNAAEGLTLLGQADVLVFSGNDPQFAQGRFQTALNEFADAGKGVVILHAGAWVHPWDGYNKRFVAGGSRSHGFGDFEVTVKNAGHPVMKDVPATFTIKDESYHHNFADDAQVEILAENNHDGRTHASVWVVKDPKTRIVCITLGHAAEAHDNPAYQKIIANAVKWAGAK
jgi:uncharacterized protein